MRRFSFLILVLAAPASLVANGGAKNAKAQGDDTKSILAIRAVLRLQAKAWNSGDIDRFMEHYWKSDKLTFSVGGKTTRGWSKTKENYMRRYPTRKKMGKLSFDQIEVVELGDSAALVLGRWRLARDPDALHGNFSLVFRRMNNRWVIIHDHTSRSIATKKNE